MNLRTGWRFIWDSVESPKRKSAHESINRFYLIEHHAHKNARLENHTIRINSLQKIRTYKFPCTFDAQLQATGYKPQATSNPSFIIIFSNPTKWVFTFIIFIRIIILMVGSVCFRYFSVFSSAMDMPTEC